jgi:hypothetical protein
MNDEHPLIRENVEVFRDVARGRGFREMKILFHTREIGKFVVFHAKPGYSSIIR